MKRLLRKPQVSLKLQKLSASTSSVVKKSKLKTLFNKFSNTKPVVKIRTQFNKLPKRVKRAVYFFLIFSITFTGTGIIYMFGPWNNKAEAAWFNDNWGYRKRIDLTVTSSASDITNLDSLLTIDTTGITANLQTNCQDLRFTDVNGNLLPHYIDSCNDNSATNKVWVRANLVPKNTTTYTIYMYYGNPTVVSSSNSNLFNLYNGLKGYWTMNESSWTNDCSTGSVVDSSVTANNAKACPNSTGPTTPVSGQYGNAGNFDGTDDYADATTTSAYDSSTLTVSAWVNTASTATLKTAVSRDDASSNRNWNLGNGSSGSTFRFAIWVGGVQNNAQSATNFSTGVWHHLVGTYDGTTARLYVDGTETATASVSGTADTDTVNLKMGNRGLGDYWQGQVDDVRFYNRALSASEVSQLYSNPGTITTTATGTSKPTTSFASEEKGTTPYAYYKFDNTDSLTTKNSTNQTTSNSTTNLITNPSFEVDTTGWSLTGSHTRSTEKPYVGTAGLKGSLSAANVASNANCITLSGAGGNTKIAISAFIFRVSGYSGNTSIDTIEYSGASCTTQIVDGTNFSVPSTYDGKWGKAFGTVTLNSSTVSLRLRVVTDGTSTGTMYADGIQLEQISDTNLPTSYCDGSLSEVGTFSWSGTAHQSNSTCSGRIANGEFVGGAPAFQTEDQCVSGKCIKFDGSNDEYVIPYQVGPSGGFTTSFWLKPTSISGTQVIVGQRDASGTNSYLQIFIASSILNFRIVQTYSTAFIGRTTSNIEANTWQHFVLTWDGSTSSSGIKIYRNGVRVDSANSAAGSFTAASTSSLPIELGTEAQVNWYSGYLDELKLYNYGKSASQALADYNSAQNPDGLANISGTNNQNMPQALSNGLTGYWKMDESSWNGTSGEVIDSSGNNNNGTAACSSCTKPTTGAGKFGNGGVWDANGTSQQVNIADSSTMQPGTGSMTWTAWFKTTSTSRIGIYRKSGSSNASGIMIDYNNSADMLRCWLNDSPTITVSITSSTYRDGNWHHLACVLDRSNNTFRLYTDGNLVDTQSASTVAAVDLNSSNTAFLGNVSLLPWNGSLDEIRVYKRVLSSNEVSQLYNWAPRPIGYWDMDEGTGTSLADKSGNGYNGTWQGTTGSQWTSGKYGKGGNFNGTNNFIDTTNSTLFDANGSYLTVETWLKTTGDNIVLMAKGGASGGWNLAYGSSQVSVTFKQAASASNAYNRPSGNIPSGWNHIAAVFRMDTSGTTNNDAYFYINGVLLNGSATNTAAAGVSTAKFKIGARGADSSETLFWNGQLDDVRVYNYARTQSQVVEDMNAGHPAPGSPVGSPVGYWKFDEGYGDTANNSGNAGSAINLDMAGATTCPTASSSCPTWSNSGKFGKALDLDGTDDYLQKTDADALNFVAANSYSWTMWVQVDTLPNTGSPSCSAIPIFKKGNTTKGYVLGLQKSSGKLLFFDFDASTTCYVSDTGLTVGSNWYHLGYTYNNGTVNFYLNGRLVGTSSGGTYLDDDSSTTTIGASGADNNNREPFDGRLDELKYFTGLLTADQIKMDMNKGQAEFLGSRGDNSNYEKRAANQDYCVPGDTTSCASPIGEWNLNENTGSTANDSSGNGYTGSLSGGATWKPGKSSPSVNFDGTDDFIDTTNNTAFDANGSYITLEAWIKPSTSSVSNINIGGKGGLSGGWGINYTSNGSVGQMSVTFKQPASSSNAFFKTSATTLNPSTWNHVAIDFRMDTSGTANHDANFYINGVLGNGSPTVTAAAGVSTAKFKIGARGADGTESLFWNGQIDQVKVFGYQRSAAQVAWDYNQGKPVGWWKMDECQGTSINDSAGRSLTGTLTIGGSGTNTAIGTCSTTGAWADGTTGKRNYSMDFDGTDDFVSISDNDLLDFSASQDFSIALWVKDAGGNAGGDALAEKWSGSGSYPYTLRYNSGNGVSFIRFDGTNGPTANTTSSINDSNWHHIVGTKNGSSMKIYFDGVLQSTTTDTTSGTTTNSSALCFARRCTAAGTFYNGQIDDVRIYNYGLTATQVKNVTNEGAYRVGPNTGAP